VAFPSLPLCYLLLKKHRTRHQCEALVPRFLRAVCSSSVRPLASWSEKIVAIGRFTRNNGITEGFHNKMELINRQAYGFRNFENYRLPVKVLLCG
jgi:transposase